MPLSIKAENMRSLRSGKPVANQFIIRANDGTYFQSYGTVIAFKSLAGDVTLDKDSWDYSVTTGKYRNKFLGESKRETEKKIADGTYELSDLN